MKTALIYFDGTNVIIREQDVPEQSKTKGHLVSDDDFSEWKVYERNIEVAKKKAIRVENADDAMFDDVEVKRLDLNTIELPEGYTYEVHKSYCTEIGCDGMRPCAFDYGDRHSCGHYVTAIIKPLQPVESEDELWNDVHRILDSEHAGGRGSGTIIAYLKSKYHITRKP